MVRQPSGRELEVISINVVGAGPSWFLDYRTSLPISDVSKLECEAAAVWEDVRPQAETSGATRAYLCPNNLSSELKFDGWRPVLLSDKSTAFSLEKNPQGVWVKTGGWGARCGVR